MADEGLHEIQLNGKQLVFLFMASTVVAVVIFLCGVMVGRGVRAQRPAEAIDASVDAASDPAAFPTTSPVPAAASSTSSNGPVASSETLTYPERLEGQAPAEETLKEPGASKQPVAAPAKAAPPKAAAASPSTAVAKTPAPAKPPTASKATAAP